MNRWPDTWPELLAFVPAAAIIGLVVFLAVVGLQTVITQLTP